MTSTEGETPCEFPPHIPVRVEKMTLIGTWTYEVSVENCAICKEHILALCTTCMVNPSAETRLAGTGVPAPTASTDTTAPGLCHSVRGRCAHCFHEHCISKWASRHKTCPVCTAPWAVLHILQNE